MTLSTIIMVDRDLALQVYWKGAPYRPSDRTVLLLVRAVLGILTGVGAAIAVAGARALLARS